jgi:hypothetical protein
MQPDREAQIGPAEAAAPAPPAPPSGEETPPPEQGAYSGPERRAVGYLIAELLTPEEPPEGVPPGPDRER